MGAEKGAGGERPAKIRRPSILFEHLKVSSDWMCHTCAPVGLRFPLPGESACCAPGFLFMLLLEESCWYVVTHSLWHPRSLIQHMQVVSHLQVHNKVGGWFHILINPAVDRRFKYVKTCAVLGLLWIFTSYTFSLFVNLVSLLLAFLIGLCDTNQKCKHTLGANWQGHIWDVLLKSV